MSLHFLVNLDHLIKTQNTLICKSENYDIITIKKLGLYDVTIYLSKQRFYYSY